MANAWLMLGLAALIASGVFAVLLVLARTPRVQDIFPWIDFFHTALVVHVDLSVLIWFLAFAGVLWSLTNAPRRGGFPWQWTALGLCGLGTVVIALAPFAGVGNPLMNNYVPVLQHPVFFLGLGVFGLGTLIQTGFSLVYGIPKPGADAYGHALHVGVYTGAVATGIAIVSFFWSYAAMPGYLEGQAFYEMFFWGGGHVLQFTWTQLMLVAWLWLASGTGLVLLIGPRVATFLFALGVAPVLSAPVIQLFNNPASPGYIVGFTRLMEYGNGIAAVPLGLVLLAGFFKARPVGPAHRPARAALTSSLFLFAVGGVLGFLISGVNTVIPAHYHGSIVGVTLAFMGLTYHLLPQLGFRAPQGRMAVAQPYIYAAGQFLHIAGLAWSGAMGIQRKTAGASQGLDSAPEIAAMGLMGLGGLISVLGGVLFLIVALRAMWPRRQSG